MLFSLAQTRASWKKTAVLLLLILLVAGTAADAATRIVPLGDSITRGGTTADSSYPSYRYYLAESFAASGTDVDFVGSLSSGFLGFTFDQQHEGHGGYTIGGIVDGLSTGGTLSSWLGGYSPDMALVLIGTNDVLYQTPMTTRFEKLGRLVDVLRAKNPRLKIYLGTLPPTGNEFRNQNSGLVEFNNLLPIWAAKKSNAKSRIVIVDHYSGYDGVADNQPDGIHPNNAGEQKIAAKWYNAVMQDLSRGGGRKPVK